MKALPWSHTALSDYLNCPRQYHHKRVLKDVEDPPGEAALWGDTVHKGFETYLTGGELPENLEQYRGYLDKLRSRKHDPGKQFVEVQYAINTRMEPCGWFDKDVWCRGILDFMTIRGSQAVVLDHKTGKRKPNSRQLKLFALLVFIHHPEVDEVLSKFAWLKTGTVDTEIYFRRQVDELWGEFTADLARYAHSFKTDTWNPRPSGLCRGWCPVRDCEHWKPKRV